MANKMTEEERQNEIAKLDSEFGGIERKNAMNVARVDEAPDTWESALAVMESIGATISDASEELADEYPLIKKDRLVNVECLFLTWNISSPQNESFGSPYMVVRGITRSGKRFRFVDGSTGVCKTLIDFTQKRINEGAAIPNAGLHCPRGLRVSEYDTLDSDGKPTKGKTFYIDNSAE